MKLSLVFELLLIFVLLAFAASKSVRKHKNNKKGIQKDTSDTALIEDSSINKYCKCIEAYCNCCRDFSVPLVNLDGPGCATLAYLNGDKMSVSLSFGKKVIANRTLSSRKPSPVCMPLPGGVSKFCGRVYNIARSGEEFRACLGLELQSKKTVEAAVRVSCFKFGARGVTSEPADPLPLIPDDKGDDDDDEDDDEDYGLGADDDEDDDDDDEESELDAVNDVESADYAGFSLLGEDLLGDLFGSSSSKKSNKNKKQKQAPTPTTTTTRRPRPTRRPARRPTTQTRSTTPRTTRSTTRRIHSVNRRPTRRPTRRPQVSSSSELTTQIATTAQVVEIPSSSVIVTAATTPTAPIVVEIPSSSAIVTAATTPAAPIVVPITAKSQLAEVDHVSSISEETFEPIIAYRPQSTTAKSVNNLEDAGLEMSLAHITGQLSSMPVIPLSNDEKGSSKVEKEMTYQKVETITPKTSTESNESVNDDMIQIVETLDSTEETSPLKEDIKTEESRAHSYNFETIKGGAYEGLKLGRKRQRDEFQLKDLDVLDLTHIGEAIGEEIGFFKGKKRQIRNEKEKEPDYRDYHEVIDTMEDALLMARNNNGNKNKKDRRRQNKMMRGEWSHV